MDTHEFIRFLDSPDIAEFNKNTVFTPAEQAILIYMSEKRSIEEKIEILQYLVDTYSEEEFAMDSIRTNSGEDENTPHIKDDVSAQVRLWKEVLQARYENDGVIFAAILCEKGFEESYVFDYKYFTEYEKAFAYLQDEKREYLDDEVLKDVETHAEILRIELDYSCRGGMDCDRYQFDNEMKLTVLIESQKRRDSEEYRKYKSLGSDYYVHVSLPFKKGDLVKEESPFHETYYGVAAYDFPDRESNWKLQMSEADSSDMYVSLDVYRKDSWNFTDDTNPLQLSYCREDELPEKEKILLTHRFRQSEFSEKKTRDFYDCIGSEEIRKYYRENIWLSTLEKGYLVSRSSLPICDKIKMLERLGAYNPEGKECRMVMNFAKIYQQSMEEILNPTMQCIYIVKRRESLKNFEGKEHFSDIFNTVSRSRYDLFSTYQEVRNNASLCRQAENIQEIINVDMIFKDRRQVSNPISFDIAFFDGKPEIYYISINDEDILKGWRFDNKVIEEFQNHMDYFHFPLPYKTGDRLKIKTPYMNEPIYGTLKCETDGDRSWSHFLYPDNAVYDGNDFIDLSYHELGLCGRLSVFDWVERTD